MPRDTTAVLLEFWELCKPRVVALIVFTALVGMLLADPGLPPVHRVVVGFAGIWLAAASAAVLNHVIDRHADATMLRTRHRPLPTGTVTEAQALWFAGALAAASMLLLSLFVNVLTAVLTFVSLIGYAVIYTVFLKRATPQNIVIGGAAGAAPPVLGWAAITGEIHAFALQLFIIIFLWTPPHFWALAVARIDDYRSASIPMLPVTHGSELTRLHILLYTVLLSLATLLPVLTRMSGLFYLGGALVLNAGFLYYAIRLWRTGDEFLAMRTFSFSIVYLMALFGFLLLDHYLPIGPWA